MSELSERLPPERDWLAELSESVQVLIAEQTPSAQSWALVVSLLLPPPPQPAARTASKSNDTRAASTFILPEASAGSGNRVMPKG